MRSPNLTPRLIVALALSATCAASARAQDAPDAQKQAQNKLLAKRAAEADAFRKLAECVYGLQINARTLVRDFVTESDVIRSEVDAFIRGIRLGEPQWFEDGSCEVPAEVTVAKVVETLTEVHKRHYKGGDIKTEDIQAIERNVSKKVIKVVGNGAPREDLPPDLPDGVAQQLPAPDGAPPAKRPPIPDIWLKVGPQARLMAERAARTDAQRRLAERIKGLRLSSKTTVRDFVTESDVITSEMQADLIGAEEVGTYYHHDELIVEVTLRVPTEQVISTIKKLHTRHYKGDDVKGADIEDVVKTVVKREFDATGMGVPPAQYIKKYEDATGRDLPDWCSGLIEADGQGTDPEMETAQGKLRAARAAELDARRKLVERIAGLHISSETMVRDFMAKFDHIDSEVNALMADALVGETRFENGTAIVTVRVPGMRVWAVVQDRVRK